MRICLVPKLAGVGGMVSFQGRLAQGLARRGIEVCFDLQDEPYQAVLVIGGTRDLAGLWRARRHGARIVQRLNGMNWLHRVRKTGLRHSMRSEYGNWLLSLIRARLAHAIIYQSNFSRSWWERVYGKTPAPSQVIYNGVDLERFTPGGPENRPADRCRVLLVEGTLGGGYETGLETAVELVRRLNSGDYGLGRPVELVVAGRAAQSLKERWQRQVDFPLVFTGLVPLEQVPELDRSAHLLFSADINAACPNSVIEALACGLPVAAFDTGALSELVTGRAGRVVPYGGDPWRLDPPDIPALAQGSAEILSGGEPFRQAARALAEQAFGLELMVDQYLTVLAGK